MSDEFPLILTTTDPKEAEAMAEMLVTRRLIACVHLLPIRSCYRWDEQVVNEKEVLPFITTCVDLYEKIEIFIKSNHSFEVPKIIQISVQRGFAPYLH